MKRFTEKIIEGILKLSGGVTSIIILLIILFLFKEGSGLFNNSSIEKGYVLSVNPANPVKTLSPKQVKEIFDENITNWKEVGGNDEEIKTFRFEEIFDLYPDEELDGEILSQRLSDEISKENGIIAFLPERYLLTSFKGKLLESNNVSLSEFFLGKEWFPTVVPAAEFGILPLLLGTLLVSFGAIAIALPFGIAVAIYLAEIADPRIRKFFKPIIELLAGIPSVVYGFFGLVVIVPLIQKIFGLPVGETGLAGSIILAIMALPTIITVAEDAIRTTPRVMKEASLGLGATHWQTIWRVVIPYSISGIMAAVMLGIGRAIGETMAVLMVTGNAAVMPTSLLEPVRTIPATIAAELGEAPVGSSHYQSLFMLGCILFLLTLIISLSVEFISGKKKNNN
ncbi:MAG TPA: phosphate ABC transporter permease subunit PstC [Paludibacteraceae bacterium]|nr:phosphate ABC transporter permease subunit PstC [Paludibacteraceae bacterium]HOU67635.1 phosphate ABC transporter permease subunit PstC [Paludibacteraceae bacterium]HPH62478.1 phosphate ABC transporter permease subunit PstC [Paludibacteraceae bacterium]HQF49661.1 phosphate ABC transporter permease subunit PstC [Paludibacteraceae bacterium]